MSHLVSDLGWRPLTQRRKNARLHLFYKGIHGLASVPVDIHSTVLLRPLVLIPISTFPEPFQIEISCPCLFDPNQLLIRFVLLFSNFLGRSKNIAEPCHSGSNGQTSIAGYSPKNRRTKKCHHHHPYHQRLGAQKVQCLQSLIIVSDVNKRRRTDRRTDCNTAS